MKRSQSRILTTHVGSLVRPRELVDILQRKEDGHPFSDAERALLARHVADAVRMQAECGIDIPSDGEYSKTGFSQYITDRLTGFELRTDLQGRGGGTARSRDRKRLPDAYREIEGSSQNAPTSTGQPQLQMIHTVCTGPITYRGQAAVQTDLANFKAALAGQRFEEAFLYAIADAMKTEYKMIVDAGFVLQIDDPRMVTEYDSMDPAPTPEEYRRFAAVRVEALNHALAGLPEDRVRYHMCWGSWHGPHTTDAPLREIIPVILKIKAGAFSVEAANPRHEHEYHVWEDVKLPEGKIIIPGVIAHTTNCVEHPELVAERIGRYARLVGRENVIAGVDCGFAQGLATARVHPSIMWEKFRMLAEGARLASRRLW